MKPMQCLAFMLVACSIAIASSSALSATQEASDTPQYSERVREGTSPSIVGQADEAGPLTQEEVAERLSSVPVFAVVSEDNAPVIATVDREGESVQVIVFWLDHNAAQTALDNIRKTNSEMSAQARLIVISLTKAMRLASNERAKNGEITFSFLPDAKTLETATSIFNESGEVEESVESFPGIPLFFGESQEGVLTIEANGSEVVPFFFDLNDLEATLERASGGENAAVLDSTQISVVSLDQVLKSMIDPNAETNINQIEFIPSRSVLEYVEKEFPETLQQPE
ncbi:MAG: Tic22 family protein [Synechococcus sp.]